MNTFDMYKKGTRKSVNTSRYPFRKKIKAENAPDTLQALWRRVQTCSLFKKNKSG